AHEGSVESRAHAIFTILPNHDRTVISTRFQQHVHEITIIIQKLLKVAKLEYSNSASFIKELEAKLPFVHWEISQHTPGEVCISLLSRTLKRYDLSQFFSEMINRWLIPWGKAEIISSKQLSFSFSEFPKKLYFASEIVCHVTDEAALSAINEK